MEAKDLTQFHELVKARRVRISLKDLCGREQVCYQPYTRWRNANVITWGINRMPDPLYPGWIGPDVLGRPDITVNSLKALTVHVEFENGLIYERNGIDVATLADSLTQIRGALC